MLYQNGQRIEKKRKTNVKKKTLNPEFNEHFVFELPHAKEELKNVELNLIVFDWNRMSKNKVHTSKINLTLGSLLACIQKRPQCAPSVFNLDQKFRR